jgi:hypothetical protein
MTPNHMYPMKLKNVVNLESYTVVKTDESGCGITDMATCHLIVSVSCTRSLWSKVSLPYNLRISCVKIVS